MASRFGWRLRVVVLAVLAGACAAGGNAGYGAAAAVLGTAVVATGVNRAVTGDCWAVCSRGYACDRERGTCARAECVPECAEGEHCVIEQDGRFRCMDATGMGRIGATSKPPVPSASSAPASSSAVSFDGGAPLSPAATE